MRRDLRGLKCRRIQALVSCIAFYTVLECTQISAAVSQVILGLDVEVWETVILSETLLAVPALGNMRCQVTQSGSHAEGTKD